MTQHLTEDQRCQIIADYIEGVPVVEIARKFGIAQGYASDLARRYGAPMRKRRGQQRLPRAGYKLDPQIRAVIIEEWLAGASCTVLAAKYGVTRSYPQTLASRAGKHR